MSCSNAGHFHLKVQGKRLCHFILQSAITVKIGYYGGLAGTKQSKYSS